jgi:hypothetical protein
MVNEPGVTKPAYIPVMITFSISSAIFFVIFLVCGYYEERSEYQLSFADDSITSSEEGIVMSAQGAGIQVYQINDDTGYISSSSFINEKGEKIEASGIKFNGSPKLDIHNISPGPDNPYFVSLSISPFIRGVFHGWIVLSNIQDTSSMYISTVISTEPYLLAPIFLIISGVCASVCIWEWWRFYRSGPPATNRELVRIEALRIEALNNNRNLLAAPLNIKNDQLKANDLLHAMQNNTLRRAAAYALRSEQPISKRIAFMEIVPSLLGITFGLFTTFTDYVPNLLILDYYQAWILFGIGLGAGSLKELVDKDSESGCICVELPELPKNTKMHNAKQ